MEINILNRVRLSLLIMLFALNGKLNAANLHISAFADCADRARNEYAIVVTKITGGKIGNCTVTIDGVSKRFTGNPITFGPYVHSGIGGKVKVVNALDSLGASGTIEISEVLCGYPQATSFCDCSLGSSAQANGAILSQMKPGTYDIINSYQQYILVNQNNIIIDQNQTGLFKGLENGKYIVYAVNYDKAEKNIIEPFLIIGKSIQPVLNRERVLGASCYSVCGQANYTISCQSNSVNAQIVTVCPDKTGINATSGVNLIQYERLFGVNKGIWHNKDGTILQNPANITVTNQANGFLYVLKDSKTNCESIGKLTFTWQVASANLCKEEVLVNSFGEVIKDKYNLIKNAQAVDGCAGVELEFNDIANMDFCGSGAATGREGNDKIKIFPLEGTSITLFNVDGVGAEGCKLNIVVKESSITAYNLSSYLCRGAELQLTTDTILNATYVWTGPNGFISNEQNPIIKNVGVNHIGVYQVSAQVNNCKVLSVPIMVNLSSDLVKPISDYFVTDDLTAILGDVALNDNLKPNVKYKVSLVQNVNAGELTIDELGKFNYIPKEGQKGQINFIYRVCLEGCEDACGDGIATIIVNPNTENCKVPTVFTPNGDGSNDKFEIYCLEQSKKKSQIIIFNEWGQEVYSASPYGPSNWWDGTHKGKPLPDGTYFYLFVKDIEDKNAQIVKGYITIYR